MSEIAKYIRLIAKQYDTKPILAQVDILHETTCDVTPILGNAPYKGVKLTTSNNVEGLLVRPKEGSLVWILEHSETEAFVLFTTEIQDFNLKVGSRSLFISEDEIIFNEALANSYFTNINKLKDKINNLESQINQLKQLFSTWVTVPSDGGAALKTIVSSWAAQSITPTTINDLKDETIKH